MPDQSVVAELCEKIGLLTGKLDQFIQLAEERETMNAKILDSVQAEARDQRHEIDNLKKHLYMGLGGVAVLTFILNSATILKLFSLVGN
jgi:uncharacterized protein YdcH (DUF465 family)